MGENAISTYRTQQQNDNIKYYDTVIYFGQNTLDLSCASG